MKYVLLITLIVANTTWSAKTRQHPKVKLGGGAMCPAGLWTFCKRELERNEGNSDCYGGGAECTRKPQRLPGLRFPKKQWRQWDSHVMDIANNE